LAIMAVCLCGLRPGRAYSNIAVRVKT